jgi:dynein assembly factor with WDR repeat domains 1
MFTLTGHTNEITDINFNSIGTRIATASTDGSVRIYNVADGICVGFIQDNEGEVSMVIFNP